MTDGIILVSDEQAKALQEGFKFAGQGLETARQLGSCLSKIFGTIPEDLIGIAFGDALHIKRGENINIMAAKSAKRLKDMGIETTQEVPLSIGLPLLAAAADENRDELVDLWARLLATAMDPSRSDCLRLKFIEVVRIMDPLDALVLQKLQNMPDGSPTLRNVYSSQLSRSEDEIEISFGHLCELGCAIGNLGKEPSIRNLNLDKVHLTAFGRSLLRALN